MSQAKRSSSKLKALPQGAVCNDIAPREYLQRWSDSTPGIRNRREKNPAKEKKSTGPFDSHLCSVNSLVSQGVHLFRATQETVPHHSSMPLIGYSRLQLDDSVKRHISRCSERSSDEASPSGDTRSIRQVRTDSHMGS